MALACVGAENTAMSNLKQSHGSKDEPIKDIAIFVSSCQCLGLHVLVLQLLNGEGDVALLQRKRAVWKDEELWTGWINHDDS